jgi:hypothetical protein
MPPQRPGQQEKVLQWLRESNVAAVDEATAARAAAAMPAVSAKLLRAAFLASGLPLSPLVEGVRQDSLDHLERTLDSLAAEYAAGPTERRRLIRGIVITARQHAEWAARNPNSDASKRAGKEEMLLWLKTWLDNPPLFSTWARLRRATIGLRQE